MFENFVHKASTEFLTLAVHWQNGDATPQSHDQMSTFTGAEPAPFRFEKPLKLRTAHTLQNTTNMLQAQHLCCPLPGSRRLDVRHRLIESTLRRIPERPARKKACDTWSDGARCGQAGSGGAAGVDFGAGGDTRCVRAVTAGYGKLASDGTADGAGGASGSRGASGSGCCI